VKAHLRGLTALALLAAVSTPGCAYVGFVVAGPSGVLIVSVDPAVLPPPVLSPPNHATQTSAAGCPASSSSVAHFQLVVQQPPEDVSVNEVRMQFLAESGAAGEPVAYSRSEMTRMFGSSQVPRGTTRGFDFSVPYGCSPGVPKRMSVHVTTVTQSGKTLESDTSAEIE
jgi:hypothetical protein